MYPEMFENPNFGWTEEHCAPTIIDGDRNIEQLIVGPARAANQTIGTPIQAVILAAGRGSRLASAIDNGPKCLARIGERTLIDHQLAVLNEAGIHRVCVVTGYRAEEVRAVVGDRAEFIHNEAWEKTNSLYSLELCRDWVNTSLLVINCDVLFPREALQRLLACRGNAFAYDSSSGMDDEHTKVELAHDYSLTAMSKVLPIQCCHGENVGLLYFNQRAARLLFREAQALLEKENTQMWAIAAVHEVAKYLPLRAIDVGDLPWVEIDFPEDLQKARGQTWPAICERQQSPVAGQSETAGRQVLPGQDAFGIARVSERLDTLTEELTEKLWQTFQQAVSRERIRELAAEAAARFRDAAITAYIPILLERATRDRIMAETQRVGDEV